MKNSVFRVFSNCVITKGAKRSIICDFHKQKIFLIPNTVCEILNKFNGSTIEDVKVHYNNKFDDRIDEYFEFLISKDLIFFTKNASNFPELNLNWTSNYEITNAIIDLDLDSNYEIENVLNQLQDLNCKSLQVRIYYSIELDFLDRLNKYLENSGSSITSLEVISKWNSEYTIERLTKLLSRFARITSLIIYKSPFNKHVQNNKFPEVSFIYLKEGIDSHLYCGKINQNYFTLNQFNYSESLAKNSCLNGKISVSAKGKIMNCPSMLIDYGDINNTSLRTALMRTNFKKYWNITKDSIQICQDCEFRHICTDCRAYTERTKISNTIDYSKPLKCGYDPYTNVWKEWSSNPLKKSAIDYYNLQELIKKDD